MRSDESAADHGALRPEGHRAILRFLLDHGADEIDHPGGKLFDHLLRTAVALADWDGASDLVTAGLCHAVYGATRCAGSRREKERSAARRIRHAVSMPTLDPTIREYYERGGEAARLSGGFPSGRLELARTQELVARYLDPAPQTVLDVGGGPGAYAAWLVSLGHAVHLVDPVELHVAQARDAAVGASFEVGDARALTQTDGSVDAVLLLGPLYHLVDRADRLRALREARRVLRPGGWLFAAAISRFAGLFDLLVPQDRLHQPEILAAVEVAIETGVFHGNQEGLFTTAYFHRPADLADEVTGAGFALDHVFNIEGPGFLVPDLEARWQDANRRDVLLRAARLVETEPSLLGASSHLLAVARA